MSMVSSRATRLVRVANLRAFRDAVIALASGSSAPTPAGAAASDVPLDGPLAARDRLVVVPTHAAASLLLRGIESRLSEGAAAVLPVFATSRELVWRLGERLATHRVALLDAEREVLLGVACRSVAASGVAQPFTLRPALLGEMLGLFDTLRRNRKDVASFERLALSRLEPGAEVDHGARRLVDQTRFLAAALAEFERRSAEHGLDEHAMRQMLLVQAAHKPFRHVVVAVGDRSSDPNGLPAADWDLLTRIRGLERLDLVVTDGTLAGELHERIHSLLPGIEETRHECDDQPAPVLMSQHDDVTVHTARDREEEVAAFVRRAKLAVRKGTAPERIAMVVHRPLPYVYLATEACRSAGVPVQTYEALPLAAEPYAAAVDLALTAVLSDFDRHSAVALLRSPHFGWGEDGAAVRGSAIAALDRLLARAGYLGGLEALETHIAAWRAAGADRTGGNAAAATREPVSLHASALEAAGPLARTVRDLSPLREPAPVAQQLDLLLSFLSTRAIGLKADTGLRSRTRRARSAVLALIRQLREAYARFDNEPVAFELVALLVRRQIEANTFAPQTSRTGVHLVDDDGAAFGDFDEVQLAGLVDGEWPDRPRRNIFYSPEILKDLGWPSEKDRRNAMQARFIDLLRLPARSVVLSSFSLEADAVVSRSSFTDGLDAIGLATSLGPTTATAVFDHEALAMQPAMLDGLSATARSWAELRLSAGLRRGARHHGVTDGHASAAFAVSALERYQDCAFKYFASNVLRLEEPADDESMLSPRIRGKLVHELFHRFFEAWDARGEGAITPARLDEARAMCAGIAEPLLARLPAGDAALERMRLFGSATSVGAVDVVLEVEAVRPPDVVERWLEYRLDGPFRLGGDGPSVTLNGVADRVDLLAGRRLRVLDYKSGAVPDVKRAFQAAAYALCAAERLQQRDRQPWTVEEAAYLSLSGRRALVPVGGPGPTAPAALHDARTRLLDAVDGIGRGLFTPRPYDVALCRTCAFSSVCRQDDGTDH